MFVTRLDEQHCQTDTPAKTLSAENINKYLNELDNWDYSVKNKTISHQFKFKNYYQTLAFINATAYITHKENHHPDILFGYNSCVVNFTTHSAGGVTLFDFICAARFNQLLPDNLKNDN